MYSYPNYIQYYIYIHICSSYILCIYSTCHHLNCAWNPHLIYWHLQFLLLRITNLSWLNPKFLLVKLPLLFFYNNSQLIWRRLTKFHYPPKNMLSTVNTHFWHTPTESQNPPFAEQSWTIHLWLNPKIFMLVAVCRRTSTFCWSMFWLVKMASYPAWNPAKIRVIFAGLSLQSSRPQLLGSFWLGISKKHPRSSQLFMP